MWDMSGGGGYGIGGGGVVWCGVGSVLGCLLNQWLYFQPIDLTGCCILRCSPFHIRCDTEFRV